MRTRICPTRINEYSKKYLNEEAHKIAGQDFYCEEHQEIAEILISISGKNFKTFSY